MPSWIERPIAGVTRVGIALRKRFSPVDHLWRAWVRSEEVNVGRLAAATAYYGFFAILAVAVTGFAVLGQVFQNNTLVVDAISAYLKENLPQLETRQLIASAGKLGIVAGFALMFAGVAWVENLRSSQRALWRLQQQPGNLVVRWLVDLGVLIGLGLLLLISVSVFAGVQDLLLRLSDSAEHSLIRIVLGGSNVLLGGLVDLLLGAALLVGVPRVRMP
ncbi:MAG: YihY/virulence factor BrkB family protein, partial [Micromonosporaceae bacterium]|nr:YihY/virulence factor BrkB family protein [Micromonosporaceae bacterium]